MASRNVSVHTQILCRYVIHRTNHANPAVHIVNIYIKFHIYIYYNDK